MSIFAPLGNTNVTRGQGIQNDVFTSNVTVNCDPRLVVPETDANIRNGLVKPEIAGKIAVEHDLCDLDVRNLTIHGDLTFDGTIFGCVTVAADGALCCPLTVRNTNVPIAPATGQSGNALCVEGSTVMIPLTDPATSGTVGAPALLFLDGTQTAGSNLTTGDYLFIDARPLSAGVGIGIDLDSGGTTTPMTGKGIQIQKGGSSMNGGGGRLFLATAPREKGISLNYADRVTLGEVIGSALSDPRVDGFATGPNQPGGVNDDTRTQTALHVNTWNTEGFIAPVAGLLVSGGTTFFGAGNETNHGHIHAAQTEPPKLTLVEEGGTIFVNTNDTFAIYPNTTDPSVFNPGDPGRGADIAGVIFISIAAGAPLVGGFLWVPFTTPYPNNCYPSVQLSCDPGFYSTIGSQPGVTTGSPAMILQNTQNAATNPGVASGFFQSSNAYTANRGFIIPLTVLGAGGSGKGYVHYQVMGVLGGS